MQSLEALRAANERAAERELAELAADTIKGLRYALRTGGMAQVDVILAEAFGLPMTQSVQRRAAKLINSGRDAA